MRVGLQRLRNQLSYGNPITIADIDEVLNKKEHLPATIQQVKDAFRDLVKAKMNNFTPLVEAATAAVAVLKVNNETDETALALENILTNIDAPRVRMEALISELDPEDSLELLFTMISQYRR